MANFKAVDDYIASFDGITRQRLLAMQALLRQLLPDATERISYNIPAFFVSEGLVVYYAGYKNHIGMYPGRTNSNAYHALAATYASGKSSAHFAHSEPMPKAIIKQFVKTRLKEIGHPIDGTRAIDRH